MYDKKILNDELRAKVELEKHALEKSRHRNVVSLLHVEDDRNTCVLVFENCVHGDLVRQVVLHEKRLSDAAIFFIIKQVLFGLRHIHKQVCLLHSVPQLLILLTFIILQARYWQTPHHDSHKSEGMEHRSKHVSNLLGLLKTHVQDEACMQSLVHCGISPSSVLLRGDKSACLADLFHVFDTHDVNNHRRRHRAGCLDYMPPEMVLSESAAAEEEDGTNMVSVRGQNITPAVDVWQVGLL